MATTYQHGIYIQEEATSLTPTIEVSAGLPVVVGTAPLYLVSAPVAQLPTNKATLIYSYAEAVANFGYTDDWDNYTLCEYMDAAFSKNSISPVVFINVLDVTKHKQSVESTQKTVTDKEVILTDPIILSTLKVKKEDVGEYLKYGTDYTAAYNDDGNVVINILSLEVNDYIYVEYDKVDPSMVDTDAIIGGVDITTNKSEGLEVVADVYPLFNLVPGQIIVPKWSSDSEVAAVMDAKCENINGSFRCMALVDVDTSTVKKYSDVNNWKNQNNITSPNLIVYWPKISLGEKTYHMSVLASCVTLNTDSANGDIPFKSPSNESIVGDGLVLEDGTEVIFGQDVANYLNGIGVVTAINQNGWKLWGNNTAAYPGTTDPKDRWICCRRMMNWIGNTLQTTFFSKIDNPIRPRFVETIINSCNTWLNGLTAQQVILGGRVEFLETENPTTSLLDGQVTYHVYVGLCVPAEKIMYKLEFDVTYYSNLFNSAA